MNFFGELFNWRCPKFYKPDNLLCDWLIVGTLTLISMIVIIDLLASVVIQTQIQGYLAIDNTRTIWIGKSFFFMAAISPLFAVHMANIYGFKLMLFLGTFTFIIGAIFSGVVDAYWEMLLCRGVAGIGGGILLSISLEYISNILPEKIRKTATVVYSNVSFGLGIAVGLFIGGYFGQMYHWKTVFFANIPTALFVLLLMLLLLPETEKLKKPSFDFFGFFSLAFFCFCLLLIVVNAKAPWNTLGWHSPFIYILEVLSALFFIVFLISNFTQEISLFDLKIFAIHPRYSIGCLGMLVVGFSVFGITLSLMGILESIYLYDRMTIGYFVSLVGFIYFFFGIIPAVLIHFVHPRIFVLIGLSLIVLSSFWNQNMTILSDMFQIGLLQTIHSIGIALVLGPLMLLALFNIPPQQTSKATAFISFIRLIAATFGSTLISLIMEIRFPFHSLTFGEQVNIYSARFQQYFQEYNRYLMSSGSSMTNSSKQAKYLIIDYINAQATIASFNDAIYILGLITLGIMCIMASLMIYRIWRENHLKPQEPKPELGF